MRINCDYIGSKVKIDVKDKKILDILSENSRMPISQIAKKVELSRDIVSYRIQRFEKLGVIHQFYPKINFAKLGYNTFHIFLLLDESKDKEGFIRYLQEHPNVHFIIEFSDNWDLELVFIAKNTRELDEIITDIQAKYSETIVDKSELLEINTYNSIIFSYYSNKNIEVKSDCGDYKVDKIDLQILKCLCSDCRMSTYEIAKYVNLGADAIGLRIKNLVKCDVIKKFSVLPNLSLLGYNWHTFCLKMKAFDKPREKVFRKYIENYPGIIRTAKTFGEWDVIIYVISENSKEFHKLIKDIKKQFADLIKGYSTLVAYKEHVFVYMPEVVFGGDED